MVNFQMATCMSPCLGNAALDLLQLRPKNVNKSSAMRINAGNLLPCLDCRDFEYIAHLVQMVLFAH